MSQVMAALDSLESNIARHQREVEDRLGQLEQKSVAGTGNTEGTGAASLGDQVHAQLVKHSDQLGRTKSVRFENLVLKAAADVVSTASGRRVVTGGVGAPIGQMLGLFNALPNRPAAGITAQEYSRFTGQQGAAAVQAVEGDVKAAVRPDHIIVSQSAITIAGWTKMSKQAIADRAELRQAVDVILTRSVFAAFDAVLSAGSTTPAFTGLNALATAFTSLTYTVTADAISEGVAAMQIAGFNPNVIALNPSEWLKVVTLRGTSNDAYLGGDYLQGLPESIRGLRVVLSTGIAAGKALLLDTAHIEVLIVDGFNVEVAYVDNDFVRNQCTILGEMRVIPIFRAVGAARLITPKAA